MAPGGGRGDDLEGAWDDDLDGIGGDDLDGISCDDLDGIGGDDLNGIGGNGLPGIGGDPPDGGDGRLDGGGGRLERLGEGEPEIRTANLEGVPEGPEDPMVCANWAGIAALLSGWSELYLAGCFVWGSPATSTSMQVV